MPEIAEIALNLGAIIAIRKGAFGNMAPLNLTRMQNIVKTLSHEDRILGRVISGGSQLSLKNELGQALVHEIENGFFEKKLINNALVACQLHLPFTLFHTFRNTFAN